MLYIAETCSWHRSVRLALLARCTKSLARLRSALLPLSTGEGWAEGVVKYALEDTDSGLLGHIYLDLLPR